MRRGIRKPSKFIFRQPFFKFQLRKPRHWRKKMQKIYKKKKYLAIFTLPTLIAYAIAFVVPFFYGVIFVLLQF